MCRAQAINPVISNAFPPPLSSASSPSRNGGLARGSTTAEDLLSRVLGGGAASSLSMSRSPPHQQPPQQYPLPPTWNAPASPNVYPNTHNSASRSAFQTHSPHHSQQMGYALPVPGLSQDSMWSSQASGGGSLSLSQGPYAPTIGGGNVGGGEFGTIGSYTPIGNGDASPITMGIGGQPHHLGPVQQYPGFDHPIHTSLSGPGSAGYPYGTPTPFQPFAASSRPWS